MPDQNQSPEEKRVREIFNHYVLGLMFGVNEILVPMGVTVGDYTAEENKVSFTLRQGERQIIFSAAANQNAGRAAITIERNYSTTRLSFPPADEIMLEFTRLFTEIRDQHLLDLRAGMRSARREPGGPTL